MLAVVIRMRGATEQFERLYIGGCGWFERWFERCCVWVLRRHCWAQGRRGDGAIANRNATYLAPIARAVESAKVDPKWMSVSVPHVRPVMTGENC